MLKYIDDRWFNHLNSTVSFFVLGRIPSNKLLDINNTSSDSKLCVILEDLRICI